MHFISWFTFKLLLETVRGLKILQRVAFWAVSSNVEIFYGRVYSRVALPSQTFEDMGGCCEPFASQELTRAAGKL